MLQRFIFKGKLYVYIWETIVRVLVFAEVTNPIPNYAQTITGKSADAPLCRYTGVTRKVPFKLRICSRFLTSLLPYRPFLFSMLPIFDLTAASQSIPIVYVPDFLPHCCLTDCSYFLCSRFLTSLLPHRPFLFSMFPIFDLTDRSYFLCSRFFALITAAPPMNIIIIMITERFTTY